MPRSPEYRVAPLKSGVCVSLQRQPRSLPPGGSAGPPAATISSATVWIVPRSLGLGSSLFEAMAMLAPSAAGAQGDGPAYATARTRDEQGFAFE